MYKGDMVIFIHGYLEENKSNPNKYYDLGKEIIRIRELEAINELKNSLEELRLMKEKAFLLKKLLG